MEGRKYPPFVIALLPLVVVVLAFNFLGLLIPALTSNLVVALALGFVLALALLVPYFQPGELGRGKVLINTLNEGGRSTAESLFLGAIVVGFASVVQATPAYSVLEEGLLSLPLPAPLLVGYCRSDSGGPHRFASGRPCHCGARVGGQFGHGP